MEPPWNLDASGIVGFFSLGFGVYVVVFWDIGCIRKYRVCIYIYICMVNRQTKTEIYKYIHIYIYTYVYTCVHTYIHMYRVYI